MPDEIVIHMAEEWLRNYGWVCPKCGRVYAPKVTICAYCNNKLKKEKTKNERH